MCDRTNIAVKIVLMIVSVSLVLTVGCSRNPVTGKSELSLITATQEVEMGRQAAPEFEKEFGGRVQNEKLQQYVSTVGARVSKDAHRDMPYEFTLVRSETPNAFALPGGKIFITAGLMRRMSNERQLAAVLGHETAHVAAKHSVQGMQRQMGTGVLIEIAGAVVGADKASAAKAAAKVVSSVANLKYSRNDEYQADEVGIEYMVNGGYNPWGMVELLKVLQSTAKSEPGALTEFFQTHPLTSKRIGQAEDIIRANESYRRFSADAKDPDAGRFMAMHGLLPPVVAQGK